SWSKASARCVPETTANLSYIHPTGSRPFGCEAVASQSAEDRGGGFPEVAGAVEPALDVGAPVRLRSRAACPILLGPAAQGRAHSQSRVLLVVARALVQVVDFIDAVLVPGFGAPAQLIECRALDRPGLAVLLATPVPALGQLALLQETVDEPLYLGILR